MHHDKRGPMNRDGRRPGNKKIARGDSRSKVFVGGLCSRTTDESLRAAFEHFGNVVHASVLVDAQSRRSRGFGYVTFMGEVPEGVSDCDHEVDGRMCGARFYKYN
jgi:RNA recognition motif-containing protein